MLLNGTSSANVLTGGSLADTINGLGGNDRLIGGSGNDTLNGGDGTDLLDGGAGIDTVLYTVNTTALLVDLGLGRVSFPGQIWAAETLISIENFESGSGNDSITGSSVANLITGNAGHDYIFGAGGNDTLLGGDGNDTLYGGDGTDLVNGGAGIDTALYTVNTTALTVDLGMGRVSFPGQTWAAESLLSIENFESGSGNDTVTGSSVANLITGNAGHDYIFGAGGNDTLLGGGGNDTVYGGDGTDRLDGGEGSDTALYAVNTTALRVDLTTGTVSFPGQTFSPETLISIENIQTGTGNDTVTGSYDNNALTGNAGNDLLIGGLGNDSLYGGNGNDTLAGGDYGTIGIPADSLGDNPDINPYDDGADRIDGGAGTDTVHYADEYILYDDYYYYDRIEASMLVDLRTGYARAIGTSFPDDTLVSIENVETGDGDDIVYGDTGANVISVHRGSNTVDGGGGNDIIRGGAGIFGDSGDDDASVWSDRVIERLSGGTGNDTIYGGGSFREFITWHQSDVRLSNDSLSGGDGADLLVGGIGTTIMTGGAGADRFEFATDSKANADSYFGATSLFGETGVITDFSRTQGDKININTLEDQFYYNGAEPTPHFVGGANPTALFDWGYSQVSDADGVNTVIKMLVGQNYSDVPDGEGGTVVYDAYLTITLEGYTGSLQQSDFAFV